MPNRSNWLLYPQYHSKIEITVNQPIDKAYIVLDEIDFSQSALLRSLFFLSRLSKKDMNLSGLIRMNFCLLSDDEENKIVLGVKGKFWRIRKILVPITKVSFLKEETGFTRITWVFRVTKKSVNQSTLSFNVEIESPDKITHLKMSAYWLIIKPISTLIRKEMLKAMKRKVEDYY